MPETQDLDAKTRLAETLWNDKETRPYLEAAVAKKFPDAVHSMPGYEARQIGVQTVGAVKQMLDADRAERVADKAKEALARERQSIMDDPELRIREDEIPAVEKLMETELIGTHRGAARLHRAQTTVATPRSETSAMEIPGLQGAGGDDFKGIIENPDKWARDKSHQILNDFRAGRGNQWL